MSGQLRIYSINENAVISLKRDFEMLVVGWTDAINMAFFEAMKALISGRIFGLYFIYFAKINPYFNNKNPLTALNFVKEFQALRAKINGTDSKE